MILLSKGGVLLLQVKLSLTVLQTVAVITTQSLKMQEATNSTVESIQVEKLVPKVYKTKYNQGETIPKVKAE